MRRPLIVTHERRALWARQLRPRLADGPLRWAESRSGDDLERALAGTASSLVVMDVGDRPVEVLADLDRALRTAPDAMVLVIDARPFEGVEVLARELGATLILSGVVTPPTVAALLSRWVPLARLRLERSGWSAGPDPAADEPDPLFAP